LALSCFVVNGEGINNVQVKISRHAPDEIVFNVKAEGTGLIDTQGKIQYMAFPTECHVALVNTPALLIASPQILSTVVKIMLVGQKTVSQETSSLTNVHRSDYKLLARKKTMG
jgi:hypothetical protein